MNATTSTNLAKEFPNNHSDANSNGANATTLPSCRSRRSGSALSLPSTTTTPSQECFRSTAQNASAGPELGAAAYEETTKLISTPIQFININKSSSSSCGSNSNTNNNNNNNSSTSSDNPRTNNYKYGDNSNSNKSASKSTASDDVAKSSTSKFINSGNKLTTATHARQQEQQQQHEHVQQQRQQTEQISCTTRGLNQINLKSSLYKDQQPCKGNNNTNNNSNRNNNQPNDDTQYKFKMNVSSSNESHINNNNKLNNANNNNKKTKTSHQLKEQQPRATSAASNSNNNKDKNKHSDSKHKNSGEKTQVNKSNNSDDESNELGEQQPHPQQLISARQAPFRQSAIKAAIANELKAATKVRTDNLEATATATKTATMLKAPAFERAKVATLTLRKSLSTPASFKIGVVEYAAKGNNNSSIKLKVELTAVEAVKKRAIQSNKEDGDDGGGGGGGDSVAYDNGVGKYTQAVATIQTTNLAAVTTEAQLSNNSIEATTTNATMDVGMRSQCDAQQKQQPQSNTETLTANDNGNQVIGGSYSVVAVGGVDDVVVVASTTTASSSPLPLPAAVNFDSDLRFGCAHYKRRAMFVTPCCNNFYKCRFCHDENESHHFDRKTLTELICSECNMRQKVQDQCEACDTRFGKYTCLICNLFDDTDKKQYHCNGCGICRVGGAENFFHCEVCDMCLPIRLKIDGHRCVENISRSHCPVCLGDIHTSRIPCHIPDCGHLLHKTCFDQLLNSGHYTCPICQTSLIDMTALWEYLDTQGVSLPVPKKYENQRIHIFCNDCHKTSKTKFNFIGLKCMQCGAYNTTQDVKRRMSLVTDEPSSA